MHLGHVITVLHPLTETHQTLYECGCFFFFNLHFKHHSAVTHTCEGLELRLGTLYWQGHRGLHQQRELYGCLNQCHMGHGYTSKYYNRFVPSKDVDCPCGEPLQTREHILQECPWYTPHWHHLQQILPDVSIPEVLGTKPGITALIKFLFKSSAFITADPEILVPLCK